MFLRGQALLLATTVSVLSISADSFHAQTDGTCVPVSERAGREFGCFITAREELGALPAQPPLYWHLDTFPTVAAARAAKGPRGTVVESLGRVWLFTIADAGYRPAGGTRVERIGPLPLYARSASPPSTWRAYSSLACRRRSSPPGMEAWYTLEGLMCVETPSGRLDQRAGDPGVLVPDGVPMMLTGTGSDRAGQSCSSCRIRRCRARRRLMTGRLAACVVSQAPDDRDWAGADPGLTPV